MDNDDDDDDVSGSDKPARDVLREAEEARSNIPAASEVEGNIGGKEGEGSKVINIGSPAGSEETLRTPREGRKWWRKSSFHGKGGEEEDLACATTPRVRQGGSTVRGPRDMPLSPLPPTESGTPTDAPDLGTKIIDLAPGYTSRLTGDGRPRSPSKLGSSRTKKKREVATDAEGVQALEGEGRKRDSVASSGGGWRRDSMIDEELDGAEDGMDWRRGRGRESLYDARGFLKE